MLKTHGKFSFEISSMYNMDFANLWSKEHHNMHFFFHKVSILDTIIIFSTTIHIIHLSINV